MKSGPCSRGFCSNGQRLTELGKTVMSEKITAEHLERVAMVYVRQSSSHQRAHNKESARLQLRCRRACVASVSRRLRSWTRIRGDRRRRPTAERGFSGWLPRSASATWGRWQRSKYLALPATTEIGISWSRCAECSTLFSSIMKPSTTPVAPTIGYCWV